MGHALQGSVHASYAYRMPKHQTPPPFTEAQHHPATRTVQGTTKKEPPRLFRYSNCCEHMD